MTQRAANMASQAMSNGCPQVEAMDRQTAALDRQTAAIEALRPAADAISDLGAAQKRLCTFLVGNRVKILGSVPAVLLLVQGVSPNVAKLVAGLLKAWGVQ